ncbi:MAG: CAP domain-containing protein, partial [Chloroflexi bacterium]|nr:CAP domain-containing protein [Chloroflexota bacterium]
PAPTLTNTPSPAPTAAATSQPSATPSLLSSDEQNMVSLINVERLNAGVPLLRVDPVLQAIAQTRIRDMRTRHYFSHTDPLTNELLTQTLLRQSGLSIRFGENLFSSTVGNQQFVSDAMQWLMSDAPHRDNILRADWIAVGVGIAMDTDSMIAVQVFGSP